MLPPLRTRDVLLLLFLYSVSEAVYVLGDSPDPELESRARFTASSRRADFDGWSEPLQGWRRYRSAPASLTFPFVPPRLPIDVYLLELVCRGHPPVELELNGTRLGAVRCGDDRLPRRLLVERRWFAPEEADNRLLFLLPPRWREQTDGSLAFASLTVRPAPVWQGGISFRDDVYFGSGFSEAEAAWRWTDGERARLGYPLNRPLRADRHRLTLTAGTVGRRRVAVRVNDVEIGAPVVEGLQPRRYSMTIPGTLLRSGINAVELAPETRFEAPGDSRRLGVAVRRLQIELAQPARSSSSAALNVSAKTSCAGSRSGSLRSAGMRIIGFVLISQT